jgi:para-nitrobenzyl esterase
MIASTTHGKIEGISEDGHWAFMGIPYAVPPTGKRRFKPPEEPEPWTGVKDCGAFGNACPQIKIPGANVLKASETVDEDCLFLNVYTPGCDGKRRPVFFYIHGGAFQMGSATLGLTSQFYTDKDDIVVVSANYRVGALGFMQLDGLLGPEYIRSGNSGVLDIIAALRWVRQNIEAFGGDPGNVTIMGQSAGAKLAATLLITEDTQGLFQRVIMQSGSTQCIRDKNTAQKVAENILASAGLKKSEAEKLLTMPWPELVKAQSPVIAGQADLHAVGPVFDGVSIKGNDALELIRSGKCNRATVICGSNRDEVSLFKAFGMHKLDDDSATKLFGLYKSYAMSVYERLVPAGDTDAFIAMLSDYLYRNATVQLADALCRSGNCDEVYMYRLDFDKLPMKAFHGLDSAFVMGDTEGFCKGITDIESFAPLAEKMHNRWINFIKTGSPQTGPGPEWEPYTPDNRRLMRFDEFCEMIDTPPINVGEDVPHCLFKL